MRYSLIALVALMLGCRTNETPANQVNDVRITADVKSKLAQDIGAFTVTDVSVNATNGVVTLSGTVRNPAEESKAVAIAQSVPKVRKVNDDLQITSAP